MRSIPITSPRSHKPGIDHPPKPTQSMAMSRFGDRLGGRASRGIVAAALAGIVLLLSGCGDNGVIARFMLKPERIIVERRPDPGLAFMDPVSRKYIGKPFPMRNPEGRVALVIEVEKARYIKLPFEHTPPKSA